LSDESRYGGEVAPKVKKVREYLSDLEKSSEGREQQVKEGLELYVELWRKALLNGVISEDDGVEEALEKLDAKGGLYVAAEEQPPDN
jgi:hypothetical protein